MRKYLVGAVVGVSFLALVTRLACGPPYDRAEARELRHRSDSLTAVVTSNRDSITALLATNDALNARVDSARARADSASVRGDREAVRASETAERLREYLRSDTVAIALVDSLQAQFRGAIRMKDSALVELESSVDWLTGVNADLALMLTKVQGDAESALGAKDAEIAFWKSAAERQARGFLGIRLPKWVEPVVFVGAGVAIGRAF